MWLAGTLDCGHLESTGSAEGWQLCACNQVERFHLTPLTFFCFVFFFFLFLTHAGSFASDQCAGHLSKR